jgi:hypothetical protein
VTAHFRDVPTSREGASASERKRIDALSLTLFGIAGLAATLSHLFLVGAIATIIAGTINCNCPCGNVLLFLAALVGGPVRQLQGYQAIWSVSALHGASNRSPKGA